jgi:hypothetical protein
MEWNEVPVEARKEKKKFERQADVLRQKREWLMEKEG